MKKTIVLKFKKKDNRLVPKDGLMLEKYKHFIQSLKESDEIECIMEAVEPNNTKAQLAKIHVMIKMLADETGEEFKILKNQIKDKCGLTYYVDSIKHYKSFADLSKEELSETIEKIFIIGDFFNINFRANIN